MNTINNNEPVICMDDSDSEVYEETEEGDSGETYDESSPEDTQEGSEMEDTE